MILVCGEALIDLVAEPSRQGEERRFVARPGGSPANVAVALGRLRSRVGFLGRISHDPLGARLRRHLSESGVDLSYVPATDDPTTLVAVTTDDAGDATYSFYAEGTSGVGLAPQDLPDELPDDVAALHVGSIALVLEPSATTLERFVATQPAERVIALDPNVRPSVIGDRGAYEKRLARWIAAVDIVKVSADDLAWLEPGRDPVQVATEWSRSGPALVVVTMADGGAVGVTEQAVIESPARQVEVVDTIGAGDAFSAGLMHALDTRGLLRRDRLVAASSEELGAAIRFAGDIAADTCTRPGADPPWADAR